MKSRLAEFTIEGLFGLYEHRIALNLRERITIIIGPNGRGKTVCLKFIEALFRKRYTYFVDIPFRTAEFTFTGGEKIILERVEETERRASEGSPARSIHFTLSIPGKETITWTQATVDRRLTRELQRFLPGDWEQVRPDLWVDQTDGEELTLTELLDRFNVPPKLVSALQQDFPEDFTELINQVDCHLIETQRLLVLPSGIVEEDIEFRRALPRRRFRGSRLAIQQKAQQLKTILKDTLTKYANLSQSLDRSFPLRVFEAQGSATLSQDQLRQELRQLDERREALMSAGILDTEDKAVTMRGGNIEPGVAMALEIYMKDATQKLDVFNNLRSRLDLFKEILEKRFIDKTLYIDRESGFKIISKTNLGVPLDRLSSGEQHQLILVFDLLFEVTEDSLILIDEPELSLHVAWQKTFIESLTRIIALNAFDVLLATHSPAVVARHLNLAVELGPVDG
jgi:predicted ATP-dependent endonuclease of OLD family